MPKIMPIGARVWARDIPPVDEITQRAAQANLHVVVNQQNVPRPTKAVVVAVGSDPMIQTLCEVGDIVYFKKWSTSYIMVDGHELHDLGLDELTGVEKPDLAPPPNPASTEGTDVQKTTQPEEPQGLTSSSSSVRPLQKRLRHRKPVSSHRPRPKC
jgi:co-chaperonin GroES (HSP10)